MKGLIRALPFSIIAGLSVYFSFSKNNLTEKSLSDDFIALANYNNEDEALLKKISSRADKALLKNPLSEVPLFHKGITLYHQKDVDSAKALLLKAQSQNPRNRNVARSLFYINLEKLNLEDALKQLDLLFRLNPSQTQEYSQMLERLSDAMNSREAIVKRLNTRPRWGKQFIIDRIDNSEDVAQQIELVLGWAKSHDSVKDTLSEQQRLLTKFLTAKDYNAIKKYREGFLKIYEIKDASYIFNSTFSKLDAPNPINWRFISPKRNYAEITETGGLEVGYTGSAKIVFASQIFWLPDTINNFSFSTSVSGKTSQHAGHFEWQIECLPSSKTIFSLKHSSLDNQPNISSTTFSTASENCAAYQLKLIGIPSSRLERIRLNVEHVSIHPLTNKSKE